MNENKKEEKKKNNNYAHISFKSVHMYTDEMGCTYTMTRVFK